MKKQIKVWLWRSEGDYGKELYLPATYEEIEEVLDKVGSTAETCLVAKWELSSDNGTWAPEILKNTNIYELNHLASLIENMDWMEQNKFHGAVVISEQADTLSHLINIAMNAKSLDIMECFPAQFFLAFEWMRNKLRDNFFTLVFLHLWETNDIMLETTIEFSFV